MLGSPKARLGSAVNADEFGSLCCEETRCRSVMTTRLKMVMSSVDRAEKGHVKACSMGTTYPMVWFRGSEKAEGLLQSC